jgi:hypothetical protein
LRQQYPEAGITDRKIKAAYKRATLTAPEHYLSWYEWGQYLERDSSSLEKVLEAYRMACELATEKIDHIYAIKRDIERVQALITE